MPIARKIGVVRMRLQKSGSALSHASSPAPRKIPPPTRDATPATVRAYRQVVELKEDVASAAARVAAIEASIPPIRSAIAQREHRIAVLTAVRPGHLGVDLSPRPYPPLTRALAIGEPDSLLRRRPDIRAAERRLATATAQEVVAAADLYPRITLTGFLGLLAGRGNLFNVSDTRAWAVTPALSWAAFDLGSARARLRGVEGVTREALAEFEQAVLRALEETDNALVNYREDQQRLVKLAEQARESTRAATIALACWRCSMALAISGA